MTVFVQIEDPRERIIIVRGAPSLEAVEELLPPELRDRQFPAAHATEAGEYLSYWNDDHGTVRPDERRETIEEVAALRDPSFKDVSWSDVEGTVL